MALGGMGISAIGTVLTGNGTANLASQSGRVKVASEGGGEPPATNDKSNPREGQPFLVTPQGVVLPQGAVIPEEFTQNKHRPGNYGTGTGSDYVEKVRIDPGTPSGKKGPNDSHFHLDRKEEHIMDQNRWPWWLNVGK